MTTCEPGSGPPHILIAGLSDTLAFWLQRRLGQVSTRVVHTAQETLDELAEKTCSLLIIDHGLTDIEATEVLSRLRNGLGLGTLPVLYCLDQGLGSGLSGRLVGQLGVSQLLFHPIDSEELARQAAATLGIPLPPAQSPATRMQRRTQAGIASIWHQYKDAIIGRLSVIEKAVQALASGSLDAELRRQAEREAHKLAGSVGTFGFVKASRLAREAEQMLRREEALTADQVPRLSLLAVAIKSELECPTTRTPRPAPNDERPLLLIVDDDEKLVEQLSAEASERGMRVEIARNLIDARELLFLRRPNVVLMDPALQDSAEDGMALVADLSDRTPPVPVIVHTGLNAFTDRVEVARLGGRGFIEKPSLPSRTIGTVVQLMARLRASTARVLAVDDDPCTLEAVREIIEARGWSVTTLDDPLKFWDMLEKTAPNVLVLDLDMPHLSGVELCRVVRNDPRWVSLPVVFLTAYTDPDTVRCVYSAGADDFVGKPLVGPELVARISGCLERSQLVRSMAETDGLTLVANRKKSLQVLDEYLRLSDREYQPVCLSILNLDRFRTINDRFGFLAGDRVLRRLGLMLLHAFRGEDIVARWSGEEFVVGMYGMTREDGIHRLAEVLEALRLEVFTGPDAGRFRASFSAGVAQYPADGADLEALYRSANRALRQAKAAGRDRVKAVELTERDGGPDRTADVVLVDDDAETAEAVIQGLKTRGYRTFWLQDGQAAAAALTGSNPCVQARLVLISVEVPGLDGLSLLKRLAEDGVTKRTPVVMLTPQSGCAIAAAAMAAGALGSAAKPINMPALLRTVRRVVAGE